MLELIGLMTIVVTAIVVVYNLISCMMDTKRQLDDHEEWLKHHSKQIHSNRKEIYSNEQD